MSPPSEVFDGYPDEYVCLYCWRTVAIAAQDRHEQWHRERHDHGRSEGVRRGS